MMRLNERALMGGTRQAHRFGQSPPPSPNNTTLRIALPAGPCYYSVGLEGVVDLTNTSVVVPPFGVNPPVMKYPSSRCLEGTP
jgi:hypothetical protein